MSKLRSYRRKCRRRHEESAAKLSAAVTVAVRTQSVEQEEEARAAEPLAGAGADPKIET